MKTHKIVVLTLTLLGLSAALLAADWPQAACTPARTSRTTDEPSDVMNYNWAVDLSTPGLGNSNYPIILDEKVYIGTLSGKIYEIPCLSGIPTVLVDLGDAAGIMHALAGDANNIYAAALDGTVYAIARADGSTVWSRDVGLAGFSAPPLLFNSRIYVGNRNGKFYAFNTSDGSDVFSPVDSGAPIVAGAAAEGTQVVFVNEAMEVRAIHADTGTVQWTATAEGWSLRDYWPVIFDGKVFIRASNAGPRELSGHAHDINDQLTAATDEAGIIAEQAAIQNWYNGGNLRARTMTAFNLSNGAEPYTISAMGAGRSSNVIPPPIVAPDEVGTPRLMTVFRSTAGFNALIDISGAGLGALNTSTGRVDNAICGDRGMDTVIGVSSPVEMTTDEIVTMASAGGKIFMTRCDKSVRWIKPATGQTGSTTDVVDMPRAVDMQSTGNSFAISGEYMVTTKFRQVICAKGDPSSNDAPVPYDSNLTTTRNTPLSDQLRADDANADPVTYAVVDQPAYGTITTFNANTGDFTYTPNSDYVGGDYFSFKANDGQLDSVLGFVTISVTLPEGNSAPHANNDSYSVDQDTTLNISAAGVLDNDTDADSDPLTAIKVADPSNGSVTLNSNGSFAYTPDTGYTGSDSFTYKANDGTDDSNTATVYITVNVVGGNNAPVANNDSYSVDQDTTLNISAAGVLNNDTDADSDPLTAIKVSDPANGSVTLNSDGSFAYTPDTGYTGSDSFTYKANDGTDDSNTATVTITVNAVGGQSPYGGTAWAVPGRIEAEDYDVGGEGVAYHDAYSGNVPWGEYRSDDVDIAASTSASNGYHIGNFIAGEWTEYTFNVASAGTFDIGAYMATPYDGAVVAISVDGVVQNTVTFANTGNWTNWTAASATGVSLSAGDHVLRIERTDSASINMNFDYIEFTAGAGGGNTAPIANNDSYSVDQDTTLNVSAPGVLDNDTDADSDPLTAIKISDPANGSLTLNSNGSFAYTPDAGYTGSDSFTYKANDGTDDSNTATVYITVDVVGGNNAPVANNDSYSVDQDTTLNIAAAGVLSNDTDADSDPLTAIKVSDPANGSVTLNSDGSFSYTPDTGYTGSDSFTYKANDGTDDSNTATVTITVNVDDGQSPYGGTAWAVPGRIEAEDYDVGGEGVAYHDAGTGNVPWGAYRSDDVDIKELTSASNGYHVGNYASGEWMEYTFNVSAAGTFDIGAYLSTPDDGAVIEISVDGTVQDTMTFSNTGGWTNWTAASATGVSLSAGNHVLRIERTDSASINMNFDYIEFTAGAGGGNTAPIANNDAHSVDEDTTLNVSAPGVLDNDTDADSDPLTASQVSGPTNGTLTLYSDGSFDYTPDAGFFGTDSFTYVANDGTEGSNTATVTITVNEVSGNTAPVANNDSYSVDQDTTLNIAAAGVLSNDTDADSDPLTAIKVTDPANGSVTLNSDGSFSYTPDTGYTGSDSFTYKANDGTDDSNTATVTITVNSSGGSLAITNLSSNSGRAIAVGANPLANGEEGYADRTGWAYSNVPASLAGEQFIQTNKLDWWQDPYCSFDVNVPVTVYVCRETQYTLTPAWLTGWTDTGMTLNVGGSTMKILSKDFAAGTITLGKNVHANEFVNYTMYTVIVAEQ